MPDHQPSTTPELTILSFFKAPVMDEKKAKNIIEMCFQILEKQGFKINADVLIRKNGNTEYEKIHWSFLHQEEEQKKNQDFYQD
jgi:hypothetical protein